MGFRSVLFPFSAPLVGAIWEKKGKGVGPRGGASPAPPPPPRARLDDYFHLMSL